jgi:hypothetical protein
VNAGHHAIIPAMTDRRVAKWTRWVNDDDGMKTDIAGMHLRRDTWTQVREILLENPDLPDSYWWLFMVTTYVESQAAAVRRQVDADPKARSLGRLLVELSETPEVMTREHYVSLRRDPDDPYEEQHAHRTWDQEFARDGGDHLDPAIPAADLAALRRDSAKVIKWVNRHVAHNDRRAIPPDKVPTVDDIHDAVVHIGAAYNRYFAMLTAAEWARITPFIHHDWKAVFRVPWIKPGSAV